MDTVQPSLPAPRIPLAMEVEFKKNYARQAEQGNLKNISISGAFLEHQSMELKTNDKVALVIQVSGRKRKIIASVIWTSGNGCGVKFHPYNNRDVQIVDDLMYFVQSKRDSRRNVLDDIFKRVA